MFMTSTGHWRNVNGYRMLITKIDDLMVEGLAFIGTDVLKPIRISLLEIETLTRSRQPMEVDNSMLPKTKYIPFGQMTWNEYEDKVITSKYTEDGEVKIVHM